jgi:hypothetical protein
MARHPQCDLNILTLRQIVLVTLLELGSSTIRRGKAIQAIHPLERAQPHRQEQLCVPLVPRSTYWYLSATPELLAAAAARLEPVIGAVTP